MIESATAWSTIDSTWCAFRSPLNQVYLFAVFWYSFSKLFLGPLLGLKIFSFLSWSRILTSFWRPLGTLLGPFWETFGPILGTFWQHVWQVVLASIFDDFSMRLSLALLILVDAKMQFWHFRQGRCWHRFWLPKWTQNGPKTVPRGSQRLLKKFSKNACFSEG